MKVTFDFKTRARVDCESDRHQNPLAMNDQILVSLRRRAFLRACAGGVALIPAAALVACKGSLSCNDTAGLSPEEQKMRADNKYVDTSPDAAKRCDNCIQFTAGAPDKCGSCKVLKGPIHPAGFCNLWAAKG